jgi:hypothetical protein
MKQLLWLGSISCSLLAMMILPSQASIAELSNDSSLRFNEIFQAAITEVAATSTDQTILENQSAVSPIVSQPEITSKASSESVLFQPADVFAVTPPVNEPAGQPDKLANNEQVQLIEPQAGGNAFTVSPGLSISNPIGFGGDGNVAFLAASYQARTRFTNTRDGELGFGVGLGDAINSVGVEISYGINSFGSSAGVGSGGFNAKIHRRLAEGTAVAVGWNRFLNISYNNQAGNNAGSDFPNNSYYAVVSQIIRTKESTDDWFSRVGFSAGIGGGQFLPASVTSNDLNAGGLNAFGSVAVRVAKPVSAILEWTGQDVTAGLSITPLGENFPLIVTPAFRDITGVAGEGRRFVLGVGTGFKF